MGLNVWFWIAAGLALLCLLLSMIRGLKAFPFSPLAICFGGFALFIFFFLLGHL